MVKPEKVNNENQRFLQMTTIPDPKCIEEHLTKSNNIFTSEETKKLALMTIKLIDEDGKKRLSFKETLEILNGIKD